MSTDEATEWDVQVGAMEKCLDTEGQNAHDNIRICAESKCLAQKYVALKKEAGVPTTLEIYYNVMKNKAASNGKRMFAFSMVR